MARLGYDRYGAQGGDWGSMVTASIGRPGPGARRRHPPEHAGGPARVATTSTTSPTRSRRRWRRWQHHQTQDRLLQAAVDPAADPRLRAGGFAGRAVRVDRREVLRVDRYATGIRSECRRRATAPGQRARLLADQHAAPSSAASTGRASPRGDMAEIGVPMGASIFPKEIIRMSRRWAANASPTSGTGTSRTRRALRRPRAARDLRRRGALLLPARPLSRSYGGFEG